MLFITKQPGNEALYCTQYSLSCCRTRLSSVLKIVTINATVRVCTVRLECQTCQFPYTSPQQTLLLDSCHVGILLPLAACMVLKCALWQTPVPSMLTFLREFLEIMALWRSIVSDFSIYQVMINKLRAWYMYSWYTALFLHCMLNMNKSFSHVYCFM